MSSYCTCPHGPAIHDTYGCGMTACQCTCPAPTDERDDMTDQLPRVISFDQIREGDTVEQTSPDGSTCIIVATRRDGFGNWSGPRRSRTLLRGDGTIRLLDRPEPPKPPLPTTPGTVIRDVSIGTDGEKRDLLILMHDGRLRPYWSTTSGETGPIFDGDVLTDWTVVYDPTAKRDDGLRERVQELAKGYLRTSEAKPLDPERDNEYRQGFRAAAWYHGNDLTRILTATDPS